MMKHASNEKKHVPYLNGNPTRTVEISKAAFLDISVGIRINYDNLKYDITLGRGE